MTQQMPYPQSEPGSSYNMTSHSAPAGLVPESAELFNMDGLSRPSDIDTPFGSYSLPLTHVPFGSSRIYDHGHADAVLSQSRSSALPMDQFIRGDAPWNPLRVDATPGAGVPKPRPSDFTLSSLEFPSYTNFRSTAVPSDFEDSGYYGSNLGSIRPSNVGASVCGETDGGTETQSFIQTVAELQLHQSRSPELVSANGKHRHKEPWNHTPRSDAVLICPTCSSVVKTKAELNKHKMRHAKPWVCKHPGCTRKLGFGTTNDLDRHMKSVHAAMGLKYRCDEGQCKIKFKDWPRADNFKQHLRRIHNITLGPDADLSRYEYRPPPRLDDLACLGSSEAQMSTNPEPHSSPSWMNLDPPQDVSGLPSGEIPNQQDQVMELPSQELVSEQLRSLASQGQHSWDGSRMQVDISPLLTGLGNHQHHISQASSASEIYQTDAFKPDVVSPVDLGSPVRRCGISTSTPVTQLRTPRIEDLGADESRQNDRPEAPVDETVRDAAEEQSTRAASEAPATEDDTDEETEDEDAINDFHDTQTLFPTLDSSQPVLVKTALGEEKPLPSELPSLKELLCGAKVDKIDETEASALVESLMKKGMLDKIIEKFGYQRTKEEDEKTDEDSVAFSTPAGKDGKSVACPEPGCLKTFRRHCELKKHVKRHAKPYACTHSDCTKRFGSKNDWKRHENSQHIQLEFWRCAERLKDGPDRTYACGKICHRKETLRNHLEKDHGITDTKAVDKRCTDWRNGRNFESRYWCGFCQRTIEFQNNGGLAWSERFDHIDAHFTGKSGDRKWDIGEWKSIESAPLEDFQMILPDSQSNKNTPNHPSPVNMSTGHSSTSSDSSGDGVTIIRKRRADSDEDASAKRRKLGGYKSIGDSILWVCCGCEVIYVRAMTTTCMVSDCSHDCCGNCNLLVEEGETEQRA